MVDNKVLLTLSLFFRISLQKSSSLFYYLKSTLLTFLILTGFTTFAQSPGNVSSNISLWLKANAGITGGSPVTSWTDQTGTYSDAIQVGTAPDLLNNQINFNPALDFDGNDDYLQITGGILGLSTFNDIWIYSVSRADDSHNGTLLYETASSGSLAVLNPWGDNTYIFSGGGSYNTSSGFNQFEYNMWTHATSTGIVNPSGTRKSIARDGEYLGAGSTGSTSVTGNSSNFLIGGGWNNGLGTSNNFNGKLAELIIYTGIPTELEHEKIQTYLAIKYGLTKNSADNAGTVGQDERDYFASDGTTIIWDYSVNSTYHNDVAGIGRDDNSELDQQKSKSSKNRSKIIMDHGGAFSSDLDFIVWGNDGAEGSSSDVSGYDIRSNRVWKTAITGTPGNVSVTIDLVGMGFDLINSVATDFDLLIDGDGTFSAGATVGATGVTLSNGVLSFSSVSFSDGDFFSIAGPSSVAPGNVDANLHLWLKADEGVTGGSPVTAWTDQSGNAKDAIQVGDAPDLSTNQVNFNPAIDFNGNNDYLQITDGILDSSTYEDLFVYSVTKADALNNGTLLRETTDNGRYSILNPWGALTYISSPSNYSETSGANTIEYFMWTHATSTGTSTPSGASKSIARNGLQIGTNSSSTFVTGNGSDLLIGGGWDNGLGTSNNFNGKIAELIVYSGVPSALEQEKIQTYLAIKYGITKISEDNVGTGGQDERDYFASDGTTIIWDYSANSNYHNDVAGIGRDDASGLDQPMSKSINNRSRVTIDKGATLSSDKDFIVWGNDSTFGTSTDVIAGYDVRTNRVWKTAVTGTPGSVSVSIDLAGIGFDLINSVASDFAILIDDDGTFAPNAVAHATGTTLVDGVLSFTTVTFTDGDLFSIAGPLISIAPGDVTLNLHLWLKADEGVTGATPVTAWADQSGNNVDAVQVGDAPDFSANQANFNPVIDFDGNNDYLQITGGIFGTSAYEDIFVYSVTKMDVLNNGTFIRETTDDGSYAILNPWGTQTYIASPSNYNTTSGANTIEYSMWTHATSTNTNTPSGTRKSVARDGLFLGAGSSTNSFVTGNNSDFLIGAGWNNGLGTSNNFNGKIAELIVYTGVPSALDQEKIQTYLSIKYGITKVSEDNSSTIGQDERDYFASDGTTIIWDYSTNSNYFNDIAGIGRDDASSLDQQKSKSIDNKSRVTMDHGGAFGSDKDFIVWGNDSAFGTSKDVIAGFDARTNRVWKTAVTGTPGTVTMTVDLARIGFDLNNSVAADFALLVDDDGIFAPNAVAHAVGATLINGVVSFNGVSLSDGDFFAIAGPVLSSAPGNVTFNLNLWLRADEGVTGTSPVTAWADQSSSVSDAIQVGDAPDLLTDQINFNPAIDFNGTNDYLQINGGLLGLNTFNDLWVYSVTKADVIKNSTLLFETADNANFAILNPWGNGSHIFSGGGSYNTDPSPNVYEPYLFTHATSTSISNPSGTRKSIAKNGAYQGSGSTNNTFVTGNNSDLLIGGGWNNGDGTRENFDGKLAELIIYAGIPTDLEQQKIQSYLAVKYGITKNSADNSGTVGQDERDYFSSDGTITWDYSSNSTYHHYVSGIGRDDSTGLDQRKSKSSMNKARVIMDKGGAFSNDKDFIIWGHDSGQGVSTDVIAGYEVRSTRVWKVDLTGTPGTVSLSMDLTGMGFDLKSGIAADFALLIDDDGTFAPNANAHTTGASFNGPIISFTNVAFTDGDFFTIAGPEIENSPGNVKLNLNLWLRADNGVTGTSPVSAWIDQGGSEDDAILVGDAPDLDSSEINYNPVLNFNGNNDYLEIPGGILGTDAFTDIWIYSVSQANSLNNSTLLYETAATNELSVLNPWGSQTYIVSNNRYNTTSGASTDNYNIWTHASSTNATNQSGAKKSVARDGAYLGSGSGSSDLLVGNNSNLVIGAGWQGGVGTSNNLNSKLAELIIYTEAPTPLEQEQVQTYLALKYGITKNSADVIGTAEDERDYFASDGTTVLWDYSANADFNNDIIGIGRDETSGLYQKQSKTQDDSLIIHIGSLAGSNQANTATITNNNSYIIIGSNNGELKSTVSGDSEVPATIFSRLDREWKITNVNFDDTYTIEIEMNITGPYDLDSLRLLVDTDGDFSDATILDAADGISFSNGSVIISGINSSHIPLNSTRFFTLGTEETTGPLPIDLLKFKAELIENNTVQLNWTTASEINNDFFTVERYSKNFVWETVAIVDGAGNSSQELNYRTIDANPSHGLSYYRLKQTDFDGQFSYSKPESVNLKIKSDLKIYPNPANDRLHVEGNKIQWDEIKIINVLGKDVSLLTSLVTKGETSLEIDISKLISGVYFIHVNSTVYKVNKL